MTSFRETPQFLMGRTGEKLVSDILRERGWYVIPSYDYTGEDGDKAPRLHGQHDSIIIPDLDVSKDGTRIWVEVKTKTAATFTRITGRLEHGIPLRHYHSYIRIQRITGCTVILCVVEEETKQILMETLNRLEPSKRIYEGNKMSWGGMIYWPRDCFRHRIMCAAA